MKKMKKTFNLKHFYSLLPQHKSEKSISPEFLTWFIGFSEGDGSFLDDGRFKITQSSADVQVLYRIKTTMGFGTVRKQDRKSNTHCWITNMDQNSAARLTLLFNGNLITNQKLESFKPWVSYWKNKRNNQEYIALIGSDFKLQDKPNPQLISLDNSWLSGFIDADGCWDVSLYKTPSKINPAASVRLRVASQNDPEWVINIIAVLNLGRKRTQNSNINQCWVVERRDDLNIMINYIERFPHKTKKSISFNKWCKVRRRVLKREHYGDGYEKIKLLASQINSG
jgi:hypothetical protein